MYNIPTLLCFFLLQIVLLVLGIKFNPIVEIAIPIGLILGWMLINRPAISLLLMVTTGVVKGFIQKSMPLFESIDYTLILAVFLWTGLGIQFLKGRLHIPKWSMKLIITFLFFLIALTFSGLYTPSYNYGILKIIRFIVFGSTMFLAPLVIIRQSSDSIQLFRYFKVLAGVIVLYMIGQLIYLAVTGGLLSYVVRVTLLEANPIQVGRILSIVAGMIIILIIRQKGPNRVLLGIMLVMILITVVSTGSRGPLVSLFGGVFLYFLLFETKFRSRSISYFLTTVILVSLLIYLLPENLTYRYLQASQGDIVVTQTGVERISTIATRLNMWRMSIDSWISNIQNATVGLGAGGFSSLFIWRDFRWYPHNIFMEILVELGLVGITLIFALFVFSVQEILRCRIQGRFTKHTAFWIVAFVIMFLSAQFSGDINDNRILFMLLTISIASAHADKKKLLNQYA